MPKAPTPTPDATPSEDCVALLDRLQAALQRLDPDEANGTIEVMVMYLRETDDVLRRRMAAVIKRNTTQK